MPEEHIENYHFLKAQPQKRQFDIFDLGEHCRKNSKSISRPHTHSFYQVIWFKNGSGKHFIDFESFDIKHNRLFFLAKNQVHYFEENLDYEGHLIHFNESFILSNDTDINFFLTYNIFNNGSEPYYQIPESLEQVFSSYFRQMGMELDHPGEFGNNAILSNLLKALLLVIEREKRKTLPHSSKESNRNHIYLKFRDLLEKNFHQHWSVSKYAEELAISTKTLNNLVKTELNKTVSQSISDRIILEAKRKLTHTNALVNQIGYDLGFKDPYYFIRFFKKQVNCSPTTFRVSLS